MKKDGQGRLFHLCRCRRNNPSRLHWQRCIDMTSLARGIMLFDKTSQFFIKIREH